MIEATQQRSCPGELRVGVSFLETTLATSCPAGASPHAYVCGYVARTHLTSSNNQKDKLYCSCRGIDDGRYNSMRTSVSYRESLLCIVMIYKRCPVRSIMILSCLLSTA